MYIYYVITEWIILSYLIMAIFTENGLVLNTENNNNRSEI